MIPGVLTVFGVWNDEDCDGGPRLDGLYSTRELAEAAKLRLNSEYVNACRSNGVSESTIPADWPDHVEEHEVLTSLPESSAV